MEGRERVKWLRDSLTGVDNVTYDAARVVGVLGGFGYIAFWTAAVFHLFGAVFGAADAAAYGAGLGTVMLAMAGAVRIKAGEEPPPEDGK